MNLLVKRHNTKFRQIGHTTLQYGQSFSLELLVHGTDLVSLKLCHLLNFVILFYKIVHLFCVILGVASQTVRVERLE